MVFASSVWITLPHVEVAVVRGVGLTVHSLGFWCVAPVPDAPSWVVLPVLWAAGRSSRTGSRIPQLQHGLADAPRSQIVPGALQVVGQEHPSKYPASRCGVCCF